MKRLAPWLFLLPATVVLLVFTIIPAAATLFLSFTEYSLSGRPTWIWFDNFRQMFGDPFFWMALKNTLLYAAIVVIPLQFAAMTLAFFIPLSAPRGKLMLLLLFLPVLVPRVVASFMWRWMFEQYGALNNLLLTIGVISRPIPWLSNPVWSLWAAMIVTFWIGIGYYTLLYRAWLMQLPQEYLEAGRVDGAGSFQLLWHIVLPLLRPAFLVMTLLSFISAMQVFTEVYIVSSRSPAASTLMIYLYKSAFQGFKFGFAAAVALVIVIPILFAALALWYLLKEGGVTTYES